jgi:hypothetical protein
LQQNHNDGREETLRREEEKHKLKHLQKVEHDELAHHAKLPLQHE